MRRSLAAAALAVLVAACDTSERQTCPGEPVAALHFAGPRVWLDDPVLAGRDPAPGVLDCGDGKGADGAPDSSPDVGHPAELPPFDATLAASGAQTIALCEADGVVLFGSRTATSFSAETGTSGAVLASCSATCSAELRYVVTGDLAGGGAEPPRFEGLVVEVLTAVAGDCEACLPGVPGAEPAARACAARYAVGLP